MQSQSINHEDNKYNLCFDLCELVSDLKWVATLSNGKCVYSDNQEPATWIRLQKYCQAEHVDIDNIYLQFRSHIERLPKDDVHGYFFSYGMAIILGFQFETTPGDEQKEFTQFRFGLLRNDGKVYIQHWATPELIVVNSEVRDFEQCQDKLIVNSTYAGPRPESKPKNIPV